MVLPASFETAAQLELDGSPWTVVVADPPTAAEFTASGTLVLLVRPAAAARALGDDFVFHDDEWRMAELVSRRLADGVDAGLRAILRIEDEHSVVHGEGENASRSYGEIHVIQERPDPLGGGLPYSRLIELMPAAGRTYAGVDHFNGRGRVAGSFAVTFGLLTLYGEMADGLVSVLALAPSHAPHRAVPTAELAAGLGRLMQEFDLLLVDWSGARLMEPADIDDWLRAGGPGIAQGIA